MKKIFLATLILMLSIALLGCNYTRDAKTAEESLPTTKDILSDLFRFTENSNGVMKRYVFFGKSDKVGFLSVPLEPKKEFKLNWFVWGNDQNKFNNISIKAINKDSDKETKTEDYKLREVGTPITDIYEKGLIPLNNVNLKTTIQRPIRQAMIPIKLTKDGQWEFIVFINNKEYARFEVSVPKNPTKVEKLNNQ